MKRIIKRILVAMKYFQLSKRASLKGNNHSFIHRSHIFLESGSNKDNIVLYSNVKMWGILASSDKGTIEMDEYSRIGGNSRVLCVNSVKIGKYTLISGNVTIVDNNSHPVNPLYRLAMQQTPPGSEMWQWRYSDSAPVVIGENVWIGENARICKGVTIGDNSIIAACSVVTKSIPANSIAAGNPAKIVKADIHNIPYPTTCTEFNNYLTKYKTGKTQQ